MGRFKGRLLVIYGLVVKQVAIAGPMRIPVTTTTSDSEEIDAIRTALRLEIANPATGNTVLTLDKIESGLDLGDEVFTLEDSEAKD